MQLVLHTGVHHTEEERLLNCLRRNRKALAGQGVSVPEPDAYRALFRDTLNAMHRTPPSPDARDVLLDAVMDEAKAQRVVLSDANFFRAPANAVREGQFYPAAARRMGRMAQLFPEDELNIFFAIRNPATLLPILHEQVANNAAPAFWGTRGPLDVCWSETIAQIREAAPEVPITVWCNEDAPMVWSQLIRELGGLDPDAPILGGFDLLETIMTPEGMQRFRGYIDGRPGMSEMQTRKVIAAFLDKFAIAEEIEEEIDMEGWTAELVEEMTAAYDADVEVIEAMPGVRVIAP